MVEQQVKTIYSFFGPPGSGKGTLASLCQDKLGIKTLSTGELCRKHVVSGSDFGKKIDEYLRAGHLIPDELMAAMVESWIMEAAQTAESLILDGFPRTQRQAELLIDYLAKNLPKVTFRIFIFEVDDSVVVARLTERLVCSNSQCQAVYSRASKRPQVENICDRCGSALTRRFDDSANVIKERLALYPRHRDMLIAYYKERGSDIERLEVGSMSISEVFSLFSQKIGFPNVVRELSI